MHPGLHFDLRVVPARDDLVHVQIRHEEGDDAIRAHLGHLDQHPAVVDHHRRILPQFVPRRDHPLPLPVPLKREWLRHDLGRHEIVPSGKYHWEDALAGEGHLEGLDRDRAEVQNLRVEVDRRERARRDDDALEALEDGPHRQ